MVDWQEIIDKNADSLWHVVYQLLSNQNEAAECFRYAFISIYKKSEQQHLAHHNNIYPLIANAAIAKSLEKLHQRFQNKTAGTDASDVVVIPTNGPKPLAKIKSQELAGRLRKALSKLPVQKGQIFCLSKLIGLNNRQIAKLFGLNKNAVEVLIHQTKERLASLLEMRDQPRENSDCKNIVKEAISAIKQESVSSHPPGKVLHDIARVFPSSVKPQVSEAMQQKSKLIKRIKTINKFKITIGIAILVGAIIIAMLFTMNVNKQIETVNSNSNIAVTKDVENTASEDENDNRNKTKEIGESAEIEFAKLMQSFADGDANSIKELLKGDSLLQKILLAKFLGQMGDEQSIAMLEKLYNETKEEIDGVIEPNPFLQAIEEIRARVEPQQEALPDIKESVEKAVEINTSGKQQDKMGEVINIEGYAMAGADVVLCDSANPAIIINGQVLDDSSLEITTTDQKGKFELTSKVNSAAITVLHEQGYAETTMDRFLKDPTIILTNWGYVAGQLMVENSPASNQMVELVYLSSNNSIDYSYQTVTNSQGNFVFENVKAEKVKITHIFELPKPLGYISDEPLIGRGAFQIIDVDAEKDTEVIIGEGSYTVTGQFTLGEDFEFEPEWAHSISRIIGPDSNPYSVLINEEGVFWSDSLASGKYNLSITLYTSDEGRYFQDIIAEFQTNFNLPGADANEMTLDLGSFELKPVQ